MLLFDLHILVFGGKGFSRLHLLPGIFNNFERSSQFLLKLESDIL